MNTHRNTTKSPSPGNRIDLRVLDALRSPMALRVLTGPVRLVRAQFTRRNAVCLIALSAPALLVTALLTLPAFLFNTPQHNEFFEFAQQLNRGGDRWLAVGLSACCCLFAFAIPANDSREPGEEDPS